MNNLQNYIFAGTPNKGDVQVWLKLDTQTSGIKIDLKSKVEQKYGQNIKKIVQNILLENAIENAHIILEDDNAFDFVIEARVECALLRAKRKE